MRKIPGFALRHIAHEQVIVGESLDLINFDSLISLNPSAAYIWETLGDDTPFDAGTVTEILTQRYSVDSTTAQTDAATLLDAWLKAGIITE